MGTHRSIKIFTYDFVLCRLIDRFTVRILNCVIGFAFINFAWFQNLVLIDSSDAFSLRKISV